MVTTQLSPGIHPGLGMEQYHAWTLDKAKLIEGPISCSILKRFMPNPYAWRWSPDIVQTDAMRKGSLFDMAVTEPDKLASHVAVSEFDSFRTKAAQEWKAEQIEAGRIICTEDELEHATKAAERVNEHKVAGKILSGSWQAQVAVVGEVGGIPAKALLDILPCESGEWAEHIVDYKTTSGGVDDEAIRKSIGQFRYHWQAAFYRTLFNKVSEDRVCERFAFVFQDVTTLEVRVVELSEDSLMLGNRCVGHAVKEFAKCAYKGIKSQYATRCDSLDVLPYVAMNEDEWLNASTGKEIEA